LSRRCCKPSIGPLSCCQCSIKTAALRLISLKLKKIRLWHRGCSLWLAPTPFTGELTNEPETPRQTLVHTVPGSDRTGHRSAERLAGGILQLAMHSYRFPA